MPNGLYVDYPGSVIVHEVPEAILARNQVRIRTAFAAIKHGTTFHLFSGDSPFHDRRFDRGLRLFVAQDPVASSLKPRNTFIGNIVTGIVTQTGAEVRKFKCGDRVFCYGPACELVTQSEDLVEQLLPPMSDSDALCMDPALFAYGAVRDAKICVGDNVTVFGLGAIGLFVVQLLKLGGCLNIIAVDPIEGRRRLAEKFGATVTLNPTACDIGLKSREILGAGSDIAIEASGNYIALNQAIRSVRQCGRIVTLGYYRGEPSDLDLATEWLHNRLEMLCSLPDWNNPSREYPIWDKARMWTTLIELFRKRAITSQGVLHPIVELKDAPHTFMEIYGNPGKSVKMGIRFAADANVEKENI